MSKPPIDRNRRHLERLVLFSDAVFAIAITLLVLDLRLPEQGVPTDGALAEAMARLVPNLIGFFVSFLVIGYYWINHHRLFETLKYGDDRLLWPNLTFLMAIAFMPFPTAVYSQHVTLRGAAGFYTGWLIVTGLLYRRLVGVVVSDGNLIEDHVSAQEIADRKRGAWIFPAVGLVGLAFGMIHPLLAQVGLALGAPLSRLLLPARPKGPGDQGSTASPEA